MSIFNRPYRNDKQMKADAKEKRKRERQKNRIYKNSLANQILRATLDAIEGGQDKFSKRDMIQLVSGKAKMSTAEWMVWDKAATVAIQKIRSYYWSEDKNVTDNRMFNYFRDINQYWLIPIERSSKLGVNVIYEDYDRKVKGLQKRQRLIKTSAYERLLEMNPKDRKKLIDELRDKDLLENGK